MKSGSVSQGDVDVAKTTLKATVAEQLATSAGRFSNLLTQAGTKQILGKSEIFAAIDGVSVADVNAVRNIQIRSRLKQIFSLSHFFPPHFSNIYVPILFSGRQKSSVR